jgi:hypothetical protein
MRFGGACFEGATEDVNSLFRDSSAQSMTDQGKCTAWRPLGFEWLTRDSIAGGKCEQQRERPQRASPSLRPERCKQLSRIRQQEIARRLIAAMACAIDQRPCRACTCEPLISTPEQFSASLEDAPAAGPDGFGGQLTPGKRIEEPEPAIFQCSQVSAADAPRKKLGGDCLKAWLGRRAITIKLIEPFAPPSQPDGAEVWLGCRRHDLAHGGIDPEQGIERGPQRDRPIVPDERAIGRFSDSRPSAPPRRLPSR